MGRGHLRLGALVAALVYAPLALAAPPRNLGRPPRMGESGRVVEAPHELSTAAEAVDIVGGLVWLVGPNGMSSRHATRVPAGVFMTWEGKLNFEASINAEVGRYKARIAELEAALRQRETPSTSQAPCPAVPPPVDSAKDSGGLRAWHVLVGVGLVFGAGYLLGRGTH